MFETIEHIGHRLRLTREEQGFSQSQIASELNVQPHYLDAIEKLDMEALPSIGYVLGYVRAYANHLGLNGQESVEAYKVDSAVPENLGMRDRPHFVPRQKIRLPKGFYAATTTLSCAAVLAFWYASNTGAESGSTVTSPNPGAVTQSTKATDIAPDMMTIKAINPSWVQVKDKNGQQLISRIFVKGESWQISGKAGATLSLRDSGAIELFSGRKSLGLVGQQGVPAEGIPLRLPGIVNPLLQPEQAETVTETAQLPE